MALEQSVDPDRRRKTAEALAAVRQRNQDRGETIVTRDIDRQSDVERAANRSYGEISNRFDALQANPGAAADVRQAQLTQLRDVASNQRANEEFDRTQATLNDDFKALQSGTPDEVQDWRQIAQVAVGLSGADDPDAQELKNALLWSYGDQIREHTNAIDPEWWDANYTDPPKQEDDSFLGWKSKLAKAAPLFEYLDQWGQSALGAVGGIEAAIDQNDDVSVGEGLRHAVRKGAEAVDLTRAVPGFEGLSGMLQHADDDPSVIRLDDGTGLSMDRSGDGTLNLREALGKDPDAGGRWLSAIDLLGTIVIDPSTYATLGQSSLARVGMKSAEEIGERMGLDGVEALGRAVNREMVQEMNQRIMRDGFKRGLDEAEQRWYTSLIRIANEDALSATGQRTTRFGREVAAEQMSSIRRGGQSGVRMGGTTIVPTRGLGSRLGRGADDFAERAITRVDDVAPEAARGGRVTDEVLDAGLHSKPRNLLADAREALGGTNPLLANRAARRAAGTSQEAATIARNADELRRLADAVPPVTRLGDELPTERALTEWYRAGASQGLLGDIGNMMPQRLKDIVGALSPRAAIRSRFGQAVADQLGHILSVTRDQPRVQEIMTRLGADSHKGGLMQSSIREFGSQDEWERALNTALSSKEGFEDAMRNLGPKSQQLLQTMHNVRLELRDVAQRGGANAEHLRDEWSYIPRTLTEAAKNDANLLQKIKNLDDPALELGGDRIAESFMQRRTLAENLDNLFDTNSVAYEVLKDAGIEDVTRLFETNPVAAFAARTQSAFRAASEVDLIDGITRINGDGMALGFRASIDDAGKLTPDEVVEGMIREAGGKPIDFRKVTLDNGTVYRVHNDIADELENVRRVFGKPHEITEFGRLFDKVNNAWARSATVFGVNPAFHIRNNIGNVFNAFLGGTRDITVFRRAASAQQDMRRITQAMRETGDDFAAAAAKLDLGDDVVQILTDARRLGVLGDGRGVDVLRERGGEAVSPSNRSSINPLSDRFIGDKPGRALGTFTEDNARLGVYIDQINKGATPDVAAQHVKQYLFDYGDLTRFENEGLRRVSRFYTFMRKNTALQAYTLAHYPARIANAEAGVQGVVDAVFGGESETDRQLPPWMPGASVMDVAGGQAAIGVDTPFASFQETMEILTGPPSDNALDRFSQESFLRGLVGRSEALFSGVGLGTLDWLEEMESGRDSFSGRVLDPENQRRDGTLFSALATVLPGVARLEGWAARNGTINEALQLRLDEDGNVIGDKPWQMQLINNFAGLQAYQLTDDTDSTGRYTLLQDLEDILSEMKKDGIDVPTVSEMRAAGEIQQKNRVLETLMYGWQEDPDTGELSWDNEKSNAMLLQILPKNVRDAFVGLGVLTDDQLAASEAAGNAADRGSRFQAVEGSDEYFAQQDFDFGQALTAIETYLDRDLTDEERWTMVSAFGGALGVTDQENAGFNPYRENRLLNPEQSAADDAAEQARKEETFNRRLAAVGMTWAQALARNPRISVMQRRMEDARQAGWSDEEIRTALYYASDEGGQGWTSRADRAAINQFMTGDREGGAVPLTTTRLPTTTDEDLQKLQTKVWQAAEELRLIYQFEGWGTPSQYELQMYGVNNLTKAEQRALGIDPLRGAPNREDIRSDEQRLADTESKYGAVQQGLEAGPYRWDPTQQPGVAPWER